jgi:hypothetical protein
MSTKGPSPTWTEEEVDPLTARSKAIHSNGHLLPVAAWIQQARLQDVTAKEVGRGLSGMLAQKQALEVLERLCVIGALEELPYLGRPAPRVFRRCDAPYWALVAGELEALAAASS